MDPIVPKDVIQKKRPRLKLVSNFIWIVKKNCEKIAKSYIVNIESLYSRILSTNASYPDADPGAT